MPGSFGLARQLCSIAFRHLHVCYFIIRFLTRHYLFMADANECSGGSGMLGIPMTVKEVKPEHVKMAFPPNDILTKWHAGEDADWPPLDEDYELDEDNMPRLRFGLGQRVQCRIGPDATRSKYRSAEIPFLRLRALLPSLSSVFQTFHFRHYIHWRQT